MTGHARRRYRFPKRTFYNQDLGPFIAHEMNRCIQCYRCVRFYSDYAGGDDLVAMGIRNQVYFGRHEDGKLESEFSGNLVEVCPTGVFTDKTFAAALHPQVGPADRPVGLSALRTGLQHHPRGALRRAAPHPQPLQRRRQRLLHLRPGPLRLRVRQRREPAARGLHERCGGHPEEAVLEVGDMVAAARIGLRRVIGIGSPRASLEANWALRKLVGAENFYIGMSGQERRLVDLAKAIIHEGPSRSCSTARSRAGRRDAGPGRRRHQHGSHARLLAADNGSAAAPPRSRSPSRSRSGTTPRSESWCTNRRRLFTS